MTYTYDNDGNIITATTTSGTTTYTYDYDNRLTSVDQHGTVIATYVYDALGRRIEIDDSGTKTWTVYNGTSADANPYADFTSTGSVSVRYLFGPAVDAILARTSSTGTTAWYLTDQLGSVRYIDDTSGTILDEITYDAFGNITNQTNSSYADRFMFAGMQYDATTGLYYDHARYYDAAIGRFVSQDPMGFVAGDTNLYRYVENSPTNSTDSSGLQQGGRPRRNKGGGIDTTGHYPQTRGPGYITGGANLNPRRPGLRPSQHPTAVAVTTVAGPLPIVVDISGSMNLDGGQMTGPLPRRPTVLQAGSGGSPTNTNAPTGYYPTGNPGNNTRGGYPNPREAPQ